MSDRPQAAADGLYVGLISGTSADGIDAALVRFDPDCRVLAAATFPYPDDLRSRLLAVAQDPDGAISVDDFGVLDARVADCFARATLQLIADAGVKAAAVTAIGSHGQTIRHRPNGEWPFTLQIGDPSRIVEKTGITTVADFRRRDMAAGGQGAPLASAFHAAMMADPGEARVVLNIGGIANLTLLQPGKPVLGFDCGPGNALMDAWVMQHYGQPFDTDGRLASQGTVEAALLQRLMDEPYLRQPPPKSTGREQFHLAWLQRQLSAHGSTLNPADVLATLLDFTTASIRDALERWLPDCRRVLVCGGGWKNGALIRRLAKRLPDISVDSTEALGLDPDYIEAATFAWLARETLASRPGNEPAVTGASGHRILGGIFPA